MRNMSFADFGKSEFLGMAIYNIQVILDRVLYVQWMLWWDPPFVNESVENPQNFNLKVAMHFAEETSVDLESSMVGSRIYILVDGVEHSGGFFKWSSQGGLRVAEYLISGSATGIVHVTVVKLVDASGVVRWRNAAI